MMYDMEKIKAELGSGLRDYLPADMIGRQIMLDKIRQVFELFGFAPLSTPGLEKEEILTGNDPNFKMQIFKTRLQQDEDLALRFDLTVPLARVMVQYDNEIDKPFKRYQIGSVWRGERPQFGRFREFMQCDADIVGSATMAADAEIISLMSAVLSALGLNRFLIKVNNRKILNGLSQYVGFDPDKLVIVLRVIDKLDKAGWPAVAEELVTAVGLQPDQLEKLKKFIEFKAPNQSAALAGIRELMANSEIALQGITELEQIIKHLKALKVPDDCWTIDFSVARGLAYYTGPVFETILVDFPELGSIFSGGRYDDLLSRFSNNTLPAVGASVGLDRLFAGMKKMGLLTEIATVTQVAVLNFDQNNESYCEQVVAGLRQAGIKTEFYLGKETGLKGQLTYALKKDIPIVVLAGSTESERGVVQIKDLRQHEQTESTLAELESKIRTILDR
ncbi:MAG: histidine--tRNA ligase [Candidatus Komeilibacteria bacterium]|nr:histidine--tRNA ligase [Candidatus Komeilibacteria bacterium]